MARQEAKEAQHCKKAPKSYTMSANTVQHIPSCISPHVQVLFLPHLKVDALVAVLHLTHLGGGGDKGRIGTAQSTVHVRTTARQTVGLCMQNEEHIVQEGVD